jgi:hypothetical protein
MRTCFCKRCGRAFTEDDSDPTTNYSNPGIICKFCEYWNKLPIGGFAQLATDKFIQKKGNYVFRSN